MTPVSIPNVPRRYFDYSRVALSAVFSNAKPTAPTRFPTCPEPRLSFERPERHVPEGTVRADAAGSRFVVEGSIGPRIRRRYCHGSRPLRIRRMVRHRFLGVILGLAFVFLSLSGYYFLKTHWYFFPFLYFNFSYFSYRFVYIQDNASSSCWSSSLLVSSWPARGARHAMRSWRSP